MGHYAKNCQIKQGTSNAQAENNGNNENNANTANTDGTQERQQVSFFNS